jgi:hypothetical protein
MGERSATHHRARAIDEGGKRFFFEKKNQKTFASVGSRYPGKTAAKTAKSFLLLFFKKEALAFAGFPSSSCANHRAIDG